ncbi:MAG: ABC transporter permease, partial [Gemmatimonadaceae bacterium]|nr:ABC transporter permease [Gemmatimonadaceae bacterium]
MTRILYVKLFRDLRAIAPRIVLMIIAMSTALVMFSAILFTWGVTSREIPRAYMSTNPASATILLEQGLGVGEMAAIAREARRQPGIMDAAPRGQFMLRIQEGNGEWGANPLQVFVAGPDDPMRIERFTVEQGIWPPASGDILIDRSSVDLLGLDHGDSLIVEAPNGKPVRMRVSGVAYYPALAPSFQEQKGHGFISTASLRVLGVPGNLTALKIQVDDQPGRSVPSHNRDAIVAAARNLANWLSDNHGVTVSEIQVPTPYAHPHQRQADVLLLALVVFGAAGLLLSAILVATMLSALLVQQIPQIGIMKAVGARSSRIIQLYLMMTLLIAAIATILAIAPGILISRAFASAVLTLLGIKATGVAAPAWMYVIVVVAGLGAPVLFALLPLVQTSRTTVREALDYRGVARHPNAPSRIGEWLSELRGFDRMLLMSFRNTFRRRARFLLTVGLLGSAGAVFVAGISTFSSVNAREKKAQELRKWDVDVQLADGDRSSPSAATLVSRIPNVTHVEAWSIVPTSIVQRGEVGVTSTYPDQGHGRIAITVVPPVSQLVAPPPIREGRWLRTGETGTIVVSQKLVRESITGVRTGDSILLTIGGRPTKWQVAGIAESGSHGGGGIFMTEAGFQAAGGSGQPNALRIVSDRHDEETRAATARAAARLLAETGIRVQSSASVSRSAAAGA